MPTPVLALLDGGWAIAAVTNIAIANPAQMPAAANRLLDRNTGSAVRMPNALVANQTAARQRKPSTPRAGFVGS